MSEALRVAVGVAIVAMIGGVLWLALRDPSPAGHVEPVASVGDAKVESVDRGLAEATARRTVRPNPKPAPSAREGAEPPSAAEASEDEASEDDETSAALDRCRELARPVIGEGVSAVDFDIEFGDDGSVHASFIGETSDDRSAELLRDVSACLEGALADSSSMREAMAEAPRLRLVLDAEEPEEHFLRTDLAVQKLDPSRLPHKGADPEDAKVSILECAGFECPYCQQANATIEELLDANPDVAFHWVHFPLEVHLGAMRKSVGGVAAAEQGKFWEYHDRVLEGLEIETEEEILAVAEALDLDVERFAQTLRDPATEQFVREQQEACTDSDVQGSPSFFIGGLLVVGARPLEELQALVDRARAHAS